MNINLDGDTTWVSMIALAVFAADVLLNHWDREPVLVTSMECAAICEHSAIRRYTPGECECEPLP